MLRASTLTATKRMIATFIVPVGWVKYAFFGSQFCGIFRRKIGVGSSRGGLFLGSEFVSSTFLPSTFRKEWATPTRQSPAQVASLPLPSGESQGRCTPYIHTEVCREASSSPRSRVFAKMHISSSALRLTLLHLLVFFRLSATQSTYWLANKPNVGKVAFQDLSYPVFRNVKDYGAVGESFMRASLAYR